MLNFLRLLVILATAALAISPSAAIEFPRISLPQMKPIEVPVPGPVAVRLQYAMDVPVDCPPGGDCPLGCMAHIEVANESPVVIVSFELKFEVTRLAGADPVLRNNFLYVSDSSIGGGERRIITGQIGSSQCEGVAFKRPQITCTYEGGGPCATDVFIDAELVVDPRSERCQKSKPQSTTGFSLMSCPLFTRLFPRRGE